MGRLSEVSAEIEGLASPGVVEQERSIAETDAAILSYYPFESDRDSNVKMLSDKMVVGRGEYACNICLGPVAKGERHRALTEVSYDDRKVMTFRFCAACCSAIAVSEDDEGESLDDRYSVGENAARARDDAAAKGGAS